MKNLLVAFVFLLAAHSSAAEPATQPTPKTAQRAEQLKSTVESFRLELQYNGNQEKPYYGLLLTVPAIAAEPRAFFPAVRITRQQAMRIIDFLATKGLLEQGMDWATASGMRAAPACPSYTLRVSTGAHEFYAELNWGLPMLKQLEGLGSVLEGDAARKMELLLDRMSGHRKEWEKQASTQPAATPEAAWEAVVNALQAGDTEAIRHATTEEGYASVVMNDRGAELPPETLRQIGQAWASVKPRFDSRSDQAAVAFIGPEMKVQQLSFVHTTQGWKLDRWGRGF